MYCYFYIISETLFPKNYNDAFEFVKVMYMQLLQVSLFRTWCINRILLQTLHFALSTQYICLIQNTQSNSGSDSNKSFAHRFDQKARRRGQRRCRKVERREVQDCRPRAALASPYPAKCERNEPFLTTSVLQRSTASINCDRK